MAAIDLKNCHLYFQSGGTESAGTITAAASTTACSSALINATTLTVTSLTAAAAIGQTVVISGHDTVYKVSEAASSGATSLKITPGIEAAITSSTSISITSTVAAGTEVITIATATGEAGDSLDISGDTQTYFIESVVGSVYTIQPALVKSVSGSTAVNIVKVAERVEINVGEGEISWKETDAFNYKLNRGILSSVTSGDEAPMEVTMSFEFNWLKNIADATTAAPTPYEILTHTGNAAGWTSSSADPCASYSIDVIVVNAPSCGTSNEVFLFPDFRCESKEPNIKNALVNVTGKCFATKPTILRNSAAFAAEV